MQHSLPIPDLDQAVAASAHNPPQGTLLGARADQAAWPRARRPAYAVDTEPVRPLEYDVVPTTVLELQHRDAAVRGGAC